MVRDWSDDPLISPSKIRTAINLCCWRCRDVNDPWPPDSQHSEWTHGCDEHDGVELPPETCSADLLWRILRG
jgi:hypothetical protein